jgi:hypothetical protein
MLVNGRVLHDEFVTDADTLTVVGISPRTKLSTLFKSLGVPNDATFGSVDLIL